MYKSVSIIFTCKNCFDLQIFNHNYITNGHIDNQNTCQWSINVVVAPEIKTPFYYLAYGWLFLKGFYFQMFQRGPSL